MAKNSTKRVPAGDCSYCRKTLKEGDLIYYVEESLERRFCSEPCIEGYFQPIVAELLEELTKRRTLADIKEKQYQDYHPYFHETVENPEEVWVDQDSRGGTRYNLISTYEKNNEPFYYVVLATFLEDAPSFIQIAFPTRDETLVEFYRRGEQIDELPSRTKKHEDLLEMLEWSNGGEDSDFSSEEETDEYGPDDEARDQLRKVLAHEMMSIRDSTDVPIRDFPHYSQLENDTLDYPDEVYEWDYDDGRQLVSYIGTFGTMEGQSPDSPMVQVANGNAVVPDVAEQPITFIVICELVELDDQEKSLVAIPLISFPTYSDRLSSHYRKGKRVDLGELLH